MKLCYICGARPNFMKIAALVRATDQRSGLDRILVHTGQHYDERMYRALFADLGLPRPDVDLEVGSGTHGAQTAAILTRLEPVLRAQRPDLVVVVGDTNSTLASALCAAQAGFPVAHVEAGLRSLDRAMPEEVNRVLTDALSDVLLVSEPSGMTHLAREGVPAAHCFLVGNVMIDTLLAHRRRADESRIIEQAGVVAGHYGVVTLHRPANVDDPNHLARLLAILHGAARRLPLVFPVHPRTRTRLETAGAVPELEHAGVRLLEPLGYLDFLALMAGARVMLTDSGGIQEETTILGIPCLTLRANTERPITIDEGTNQLVGTDPSAVFTSLDRVLAQGAGPPRAPALWDGRAGERIADLFEAFARHGVPRR